MTGPSPRREPSWIAVWLGAVLLVLLATVASALLRHRPGRERRNVVYGRAGGQRLLLDIDYPPGPHGPRHRLPALMAIHGGGWRGGDKSNYRAVIPLFTRSGYVVFSVNYRLVNAHGSRWPAQLDDVQRAVRWVRAHSSELGVDPDRIGAFGDSAGGHLVALLGTCDTRDNSDPALASFSSRVACVVDDFGPTDFSEAALRKIDPRVAPLVRDLFGATAAEAPKAYREGSPVSHVDSHTVPFLTFHGTADPIVPMDQSERLLAALQKAHVEARLVRFAGEGHGFARKEDQEQWRSDTLAFFDKHLRSED